MGAEGAPGRPAGLRYVLVQPPGDQAAECPSKIMLIRVNCL